MCTSSKLSVPDKKKYLAIVPARGGSKRLPHKNVLPIAGKPLIGWTIEAALASKKIDTVVVSSDDDAILEISAQFGCQLIKRPAKLAKDTSTSFDAIKHAIENSSEHDYIVLLQPTSPLRSRQQIDEAIELLEEKQADAIISLTEMDHSPLWANTLPEDLSMAGFLREDLHNQRSQDLPIYYRLNGAIYICKTNKFLETGGFFLKENIYAYVMDEKSSVDIDTELDFQWAEFLIMGRASPAEQKLPGHYKRALITYNENI